MTLTFSGSVRAS